MSELKPESVAAVVSGKAMPADIFTGESLMKYFARKYLDMQAQRDTFRNAEVSWEKAMMDAIGEDGVGSVGKAIAELKAQRDALAENEGYKQAFYEMAEILGAGARPDSPKNVFDLVIKPKLEALMKERGKLASENITLTGLVTSWPQERCPVTEAVTDVQPDDLFPETNSYLNSVRAEGVEALTKILQVMIDAGDFVGDEVGAIAGAIDAGNYHAAQLRASKDDE